MAKYTKETLEAIVLESISVAEVLRKLGLRQSGGSHSHITKKLTDLNIDTSHFLGQRSSQGKRHKGGSKKKEASELLVERNHGQRQKAHLLRRAMIDMGLQYKCDDCGISDLWNGKQLRLQVDHKNGNWLDDRLDNLRFMCPNCHSQTPGYNGSQGHSELTSRAKYGRAKRKTL